MAGLNGKEKAFKVGEWHLRRRKIGLVGGGTLLSDGEDSSEHLCPPQVNNTAFDQDRLCNVGFWEAMEEEDWDCVFFHDVNLLLEEDHNLYTCDIFSAHVSVAIDKFNYNLPHPGHLGGVFALRPIHYLKMNGFSNRYWGWDDDDDNIAAGWEALLQGAQQKGLQVLT
ncbi:hypothetical protein P7K49_034945 [Saguinus oedipus]|uniref:Uncharacterized protein n=1 Tax=Saguinus oedipus TaxID=9490 RepID=A0ABQ9TW59_SAGOE|nr:hypothetical protein P7K49_034945 [Saguinus oedipus]